jgi:regulatory protein
MHGAPDAFEVVSVELKGAAGEMVRIHLSDGSFFVLHAEVFARCGLQAGSALDAETRTRLVTRSDWVRARVQALRLLSRAAQTRRGLARKLAVRGFEPPAIRYALLRMTELGYLDDRVFAESWVRLRLSAGKDGGIALYRGLLARGVPRPVAEGVVSDAYTLEEEIQNGRRLVEGLSRSTAIRKMTGRGFRSRAIAAVIREIPRTARGQEGDES